MITYAINKNIDQATSFIFHFQMPKGPSLLLFNKFAELQQWPKKEYAEKDIAASLCILMDAEIPSNNVGDYMDDFFDLTLVPNNSFDYLQYYLALFQ